MKHSLHSQIKYILADKCRQSARECEDDARQSTDHAKKKILLALTREWTALADAIDDYNYNRKPAH